MKIIRKIKPEMTAEKPKKRVAAYARVSRQTERLMHSVSAQVSYYSSLIQSNPEWEYAGVYADSGISGLSIAGRDEFSRMLADCDAGKIDLILCKSISRFARNTVDLLNTVRHLKEIGVEVRFEKENISSFSKDGEFMMTILASFAEEESRNISENVKWGLRKRMESGEIGIKNKHVFGYRYDENQQKYVIVPEEAEIVRYIFEQYAAGIKLRTIQSELEKSGIKSVNGYDFSFHAIHYILRNEIYIGDLKYQKCFVPDPILKNKVPNRGELPQYYISDCHEPIISRELFEQAQAETERRAGTINPVYCFTGKIRCGICGRTYSRNKNISRGKIHIYWVCRAKKEAGVTCESKIFQEKELLQISASVLSAEKFDETDFCQLVNQITVQPDGSLIFHLFSGENRVWQNRHISDFLHTATVTNCFQDKIFCEQCGNSYHIHKDRKYIYWKCRGKHLKDVHCHSKNYTDFQLRQISAFVMEISEFSETEFERQIQKIIVLENDSLQFYFINGRIKKWQKM